MTPLLKQHAVEGEWWGQRAIEAATEELRRASRSMSDAERNRRMFEVYDREIAREPPRPQHRRRVRL